MFLRRSDLFLPCPMRYKIVLFILLCFFVYSHVWTQDSLASIPTVSVEGYLDQKMDSIVSNHPMVQTLGEERMIALDRKADNKTGIFLLSLGGLFFFALIRNFFTRYFGNLFALFTSFTITKRQTKEQLENDSVASFWFYVLFFISLTALIIFTARYFHALPTSKSVWQLFLIGFGILVSFYILKISLVKAIAWTFQKKEIASQFSFNSSVVNEFLGVILFPICILMLLSEGKFFNLLLWLCLIIFSILLIYRYIRVFRHVKNILRIDLFHFLLYLCAFEIMPILILIKIAL